MLARIQESMIHHFVQDGNDILQFDISFTEYPELPTYGITLDVTGITTKTELKAAIVPEVQALVDRVQAQMGRDATVQTHFDDWGWLVEFETENL